MASVKVTVTLGKAELAQIKKLARDGKAPSVSGFVQQAVRVALADVAGWRSLTLKLPSPPRPQAIRRPAQQARLARLTRQPTTLVAELDGPDATQVGILLAKSATKDIVDAHVVICARRSAQAIVTSDGEAFPRILDHGPGQAFLDILGRGVSHDWPDLRQNCDMFSWPAACTADG